MLTEFTEYDSKWKTYHILNIRKGTMIEFSYEISEFSHRRYLPIKCEREEWRPVLMIPLDFMADMPKTIFVVLAHDAVAGFSYKLQIKSLPTMF